jgi:hypothetical protein
MAQMNSMDNLFWEVFSFQSFVAMMASTYLTAKSIADPVKEDDAV